MSIPTSKADGPIPQIGVAGRELCGSSVKRWIAYIAHSIVRGMNGFPLADNAAPLVGKAYTAMSKGYSVRHS